MAQASSCNNSTWNNKLYSLKEELFNSITHGLGALLAIAGSIIMLVISINSHDVMKIVSSTIYGIALITLYTSSTLYHAVTHVTAKKVLRAFDHCSIFLLIAGTYTPFTLIAMQGTTGYILFACIWLAAITGIILNIVSIERFKVVSMLLYIVMGWSIAFTIKPLMATVSTAGLILLILGGLSYTGGIIFYSRKNVKYMHSVWHLFVLAGSVLHFFAIVLYVL